MLHRSPQQIWLIFGRQMEDRRYWSHKTFKLDFLLSFYFCEFRSHFTCNLRYASQKLLERELAEVVLVKKLVIIRQLNLEESIANDENRSRLCSNGKEIRYLKVHLEPNEDHKLAANKKPSAKSISPHILRGKVRKGQLPSILVEMQLVYPWEPFKNLILLEKRICKT